MSERPLMLINSLFESVHPVQVYVREGKVQTCESCHARALYWHGVYLCRTHAEALAVILRRMEGDRE